LNKQAVIYLRVSSTEQSVSNQPPELERICKEKGWEIVEVLKEEASAWQGKRENFQTLSTWPTSREKTYRTRTLGTN